MATINFPTNFDNSSNINIRPGATDLMTAGTSIGGPEVVDKIYTEIEAIQLKIGKNSDANTASFDFKLSGITNGDKAASLTGAEIITNKIFTSPTINGTVGGTPTFNSPTINTPILTLPYWDHWAAIPTSNLPTYASSTTITNPTGIDWTNYLQVGDKVALTQTTIKYFYVTAVTSTTLTVNGGTDYTVANATITNFKYSKSVSPQGFPTYFNYSPTVTSETGTLTTTTASGYFSLSGRHMFVVTQSNITTAGTGGGNLKVSLPLTAVKGGEGSARENAAVGYACSCEIVDTGTTMNILKYDATTIIASGRGVFAKATYYI